LLERLRDLTREQRRGEHFEIKNDVAGFYFRMMYQGEMVTVGLGQEDTLILRPDVIKSHPELFGEEYQSDYPVVVELNLPHMINTQAWLLNPSEFADWAAGVNRELAAKGMAPVDFSGFTATGWGFEVEEGVGFKALSQADFEGIVKTDAVRILGTEAVRFLHDKFTVNVRDAGGNVIGVRYVTAEDLMPRPGIESPSEVQPQDQARRLSRLSLKSRKM
jgi:hypothetical protein